ncbi:MAG: three-Cys-motif partner protein TcmP, partial [Aliivibrio sp.]|uniref:three-Cys-motif partner protein TcmP n=1 Tax=Aliivibrio sp. TaxID=1872443 RepID=UPI001A597F7A|nr:three-Cys-motif partner protein TcmP [Aliivibrio sp.]
FAGELDNTIQIWTGDFNALVNDAIKIAEKRSQKGRSLFFLDQYGWSNVAFGSVRQILSRLAKAEIFLTFSVDALIDYMSPTHVNRESYKLIDADPGFVRELLSIKDTGAAWRTLIQNELYRHIQKKTNAEFYSSFFIKSPEAHRSYWFIHLSRHREARNEIGKIHWEENAISLHHGRAGLDALGFAPGIDPEQLTMGYAFDDHARNQSISTLMEQIPRRIYNALDADLAPSLEQIFGLHCNDTPVTRDIFEKALIDLRKEGEIYIEDTYGKEKPRSNVVNWTDRIVLNRQMKFFGPFGVRS